ncbi:MAG: AAC(3)-I family aminoglycoside N-acetyltransferase [Bacteroidota bacterium]
MERRSDYQTQSLSPEDIKLLRGMLNLFGEVFDERDTYCHNQPDDSYLHDLLSKNYFIALVARQEGRVVGGLAAYELMKFEQQRSEIYIYDLAVSESFRRRGVATQLINHLQSVAAERGAYVIFVQADYADDPAIKLYEKLGEKEEVLHFDISPEIRS